MYSHHKSIDSINLLINDNLIIHLFEKSFNKLTVYLSDQIYFNQG